MHLSRKAFTLIELLVVIAIIAILSVVVILTLNPAELLRQSRDANRLSDLGTMNSALNLYSTDQSTSGNFSMGSTSTLYISIPDPSATSTAGDQCQGLGLPALASGYSYHCAASSTYRLTNGTGWIPVNFSNITSGAPFGNLPVDGTNQSSSYLYYTYATDGTKYAITATLESQKYIKQYLLTTNPDPARYALGSNLTLVPQSEGLVGYWNFDEGSGSTTIDQSGNGSNGAWNGIATGTSGYYSAGRVGAWAGTFDGSTNYVNVGNVGAYANNFTVSFWVNPKTFSGEMSLITKRNGTAAGWAIGISGGSSPYSPVWRTFNGGSQYDVFGAAAIPISTWSYITVVSNNSTGVTMYVNGVQNYVGATTNPAVDTTSLGIGAPNGGAIYTQGSIDDVRVYNRALSAVEVQALYNAEK